MKLAGTDVQKICCEVSTLPGDEQVYKIMRQAHNSYGDGQACQFIVDVLLAHKFTQYNA